MGLDKCVSSLVLIAINCILALGGALVLYVGILTAYELDRASGDEETVNEKFDQVYCYGQAAYICNQASVSDALVMFSPVLDSPIAALFENTTGGVNALCDDYLNDYEVISANEKRLRTANALKFCGVFHSIGDSKSLSIRNAEQSPYISWKVAHWLGIASVIVCAGVLMVITFACTLRLCDQRPLDPWTVLSTPKQH
ncbi:unnamed protein product [Peronospora destructor]|uniref:Uncharacterized protein n=1 Tax=Peronospora destructor TaxID=86335 RepID=A0AAV0UB83_9STRA|nr:unnamed protein product [Peronospora destructor]